MRRRKKKEPPTAITTVNVGDEPRTPAELAVQFNADMMQGFMQMSRLVVAQNESLTRELATRRAFDEESENRRIRMLELTEDLLDRREERESEKRKDKLKADAIAKGLDDFRPVMHLLANKILGQNLLGSPSDATTMLIRWFETLDDAQAAKFMSDLRPEQAAGLIAIIDTLKKEEKKRGKTDNSTRAGRNGQKPQ